MRKSFSTLLFFLAISLFVFGENKPPKLVVGIVVDQMRADYLAKFWDNFGEGGFSNTFDVSQLSAGVYFVEVKVDDKSATKKFIKI